MIDYRESRGIDEKAKGDSVVVEKVVKRENISQVFILCVVLIGSRQICVLNISLVFRQPLSLIVSIAFNNSGNWSSCILKALYRMIYYIVKGGQLVTSLNYVFRHINANSSTSCD